jgi:hypothetical protein
MEMELDAILGRSEQNPACNKPGKRAQYQRDKFRMRMGKMGSTIEMVNRLPKAAMVQIYEPATGNQSGWQKKL